MVSRIDHVIIDVQDRMEEAVQRYTALGFHVTEGGQHGQSSLERLAVFGTDYLELLGAAEGGSAARSESRSFPVGLNGLVFAQEDTNALWANLRGRGVPADAPISFSRPLELPNRQRTEVRVDLLRLSDRSIFDGRVAFCEHRTPGLIWQPEWQGHANGALAIARVVLCVEDPDRTAEAFERLFGPGTVAASEGGVRRLWAGEVAVEMVQRELLERQMGDAMPEAAGRADHMVLLGLRVRSLRRAGDVLRANGMRGVRADGRGILVPPAEAMNVALEFSGEA